MTIRLRGGGGVGDCFYIYPLAKYLIDQGEQVEILSDHPIFYRPLRCKVSPRSNVSGNVLNCRYGPRYPDQTTNLWEDTLIMAGLDNKGIKFEIDYKREYNFKHFSTDKKIILIKTPTYSMGKKGTDTERLIPNPKYLQSIIDEFKNDCFFIKCGLRNEYPDVLTNFDLDLSNTKNLIEILSLVDQSDMVLCQSSFFVSMAEALDKKLMIGFCNEGMTKPFKFYHYITPQKVICKPETSTSFIDNESIDEVHQRFWEHLNKDMK